MTEETKTRPKEINYIQYEHSDNEDENSFVPENFEKIDIHSSLQTDNTRVIGIAEDTKIQDEMIR